MTCALPYHSTPDFVKLVQLANLEGTSFYFLKHVKERGAAPPRDQLVARCVNDAAFLSFVCDAAAASASAKVRPGLTTPLPSLVSEPAKNLASAISDEKSQSRARMSELRGPVRSRLLRSRLACSLVTSRVSFLRPFGPPPFLPSDAAAIRGVKQPRRDRLASRWKIASVRTRRLVGASTPARNVLREQQWTNAPIGLLSSHRFPNPARSRSRIAVSDVARRSSTRRMPPADSPSFPRLLVFSCRRARPARLPRFTRYS